MYAEAFDEDQERDWAEYERLLAVLPDGVEIVNPLDFEEWERLVPRPTLIVPDRAKQALENNPMNRKVSRYMVLRHVQAMTRGEWNFNGQTIGLDLNGNLVDGQHRLTALVETNMAMWVIVVAGLDPQAQETTDTGKSRTLANMLERRGEQDPRGLAAAVSWYWKLINNKMMATDPQWRAPTIQQGLQVLEENPRLRDDLVLGRQVGEHVRAGRTLFPALYYYLANFDEEDTAEFFERLRDGQLLVEGDPVYALRSSISNLVARTDVKTIPGDYLAAITIKAWNGYRKGTVVKLLKFRRGGASPEPFPQPIQEPL